MYGTRGKNEAQETSLSGRAMPSRKVALDLRCLDAGGLARGPNYARNRLFIGERDFIEITRARS